MEKYLRPERFDGDPTSGQTSDVSAQWRHWRKTFENFLGTNEKIPSDVSKLQLLINYISSGLYKYIEHCGDYKEAIKTLEGLFIKPKSEIFARYKLATRKQQASETIDQYIQALHLLGKDCQFKDTKAVENEKAFIRDAFIAGMISPEIRQRLLENQMLSLEEACNQARALESAKIQTASYVSQSLETVTPFAAASNLNRNLNQSECYFCGKSRHPRRFCPAANATCLKCGKNGHFAKACKSQGTTPITSQKADNTASCIPLASTTGFQKCIISIHVNGVPVKALIDTGSTTSFIDKDVIRQYGLQTEPWSQKVLMASSALQEQIKEICYASVQINDHNMPNTPLRVMKDLCTQVILGHDILKHHSELTIEFGGTQPKLRLCALEPANIEPVNLFRNLSADCKPIVIKSRRYTPDDQAFIETEIKKLLSDGIIEKSTSSWRSQVLVTSGTHHKKRMCIDYSQTVNKFTYLDAYPIPNIEDLVSKVSKFKVFSKIDLKSAYHQIPIIAMNKPMTAFEAAGNLYQFCRIPFGVTNGVACFQRAIDSILQLSNLDSVYSYLDDITVCGVNQEDHDQKLNKFMKVAEKYNLTINKDKSEFSVKNLNILGYNINDGVVKPDKDRLAPLLEMPVPHDAAALRRTIGLFSHYSKWVPDFSNKIRALIDVEVYPLNEKQIAAFQNMKQIISKASLSTIDPKEPFTIETDASEHSIAASLTQNERPVAFFSRTLNESERKYPSIEKEACAIVESLKKWRHYLLGRQCYLITDQKSVAFMMNGHASKIKNEKIQRWRMELANYKIDIKYRCGKENIVADTLSRITATCANTNGNDVMRLHESLCHPGVTRMIHWVRCKNLPYSVEEVKRVIMSCKVCAEEKPRFKRDLSDNLIKATTPFERLSLDFKGPIPSCTENKYILTVIDEYSRFPFAYPCRDTSSDSVVKSLTELFSMFGIPCMIHTDQGAAFMSRELKDFLNAKGIATSRSAPYNPQCNGQVERLNGTLWQTIRLALKTRNMAVEMWENVLTQSLHSIRSLLCTATNMTPHERMFVHPRRSSSGQSLPTWFKDDKVLLKKHVRNKYDPLVEEVEMIEPSPMSSRVRFANGREIMVSNRHLAPRGGGADVSETSDSEDTEFHDAEESRPLPADPRRSERSRRPPNHLQDYETNLRREE